MANYTDIAGALDVIRCIGNGHGSFFLGRTKVTYFMLSDTTGLSDTREIENMKEQCVTAHAIKVFSSGGINTVAGNGSEAFHSVKAGDVVIGDFWKVTCTGTILIVADEIMVINLEN